MDQNIIIKPFSYGFTAIVEIIRELDLIKSNGSNIILDLRHRGLDNSSLAYFLKYLQSVEINFKKLDLSGNKLGNESFEQLCNLVCTNYSIYELSIGTNSLDDDNIIHLANSLKNNHVVKVIDLFNNRITDDGAVHIINLLRTNYTIMHIDLAANILSDKIACQFIDIIKTNYVLKSVNLINSMINIKLIREINSLLNKNRTKWNPNNHIFQDSNSKIIVETLFLIRQIENPLHILPNELMYKICKEIFVHD